MARVEMDVATLMIGWRPGSHDTADGPEGADLAWTWHHERRDLLIRDHERTRHVLELVADFGPQYADETHPITLGSDNRVWDGHHRIVAALALGLESLVVDIVDGGEDQ